LVKICAIRGGKIAPEGSIYWMSTNCQAASVKFEDRSSLLARDRQIPAWCGKIGAETGIGNQRLRAIPFEQKTDRGVKCGIVEAITRKGSCMWPNNIV